MRIPGASSHLISEGSVVIMLWVFVFAVLASMGDIDAVSHVVEFILLVASFSSIVVVAIVLAAVGLCVGHQLFDPSLKRSLCVLMLRCLIC